MKIALDYDKTYTADTVFWDRVIAMGRAMGHEFVCVTGRNTPPGPHERPIPMPIVCAGSGYKRRAAEKSGHQVDVWIDDMPEMVAPSRVLDFGDCQ